MGSSGEGIVLPTKIDLSGFTKGTKQLESAIKSLSNKAKSISGNMEKAASKMANPLKRLLPTILGVGSAFGIISKAVSAFMAQNEQLSAKMSSIWTALGNLLGPIITQIIDWVTTAVSYFLSFLKLLGVTGKTASQLSQKANQSASELKKTIAGFDELNVLQDNNGGRGGAGLEDVDPSEWMKKLADLLKNKLWDQAADLIIEKLNEIIYKVRDKAYEVGQKIGEYLQGIIHVISKVLNDTDWKQLGVGIANFFNGLIAEVEGLNFGEDLGKLLVAKFTIAFKILTGFLETLNWERLGDILSGVIIGAFNALAEAIEGADFQKIGNGIRDFFLKIWEHKDEIVAAIFGLLEAAWNGAWDLFLGLLGKGTDDELPIVKQFEGLKKAVEDFAEAVNGVLGSAWNDILKPMLEWAGNVALPGILESITTELERLAGLLNGEISFGEFIESMTLVEGVATAVGTAIGGIKLALFAESVANLTATGMLGKLTEVFALVAGGAGSFGEALTTVFPLLGKIGAGFKVLWGVIAANPLVAVVAVVAALVAAFIHAYKTNDEFREKVDEVWGHIKDFISSAVEAIKERISAFKERVSDAFSAINQKIQEVRTWFGNLCDSVSNGVSRIKDGISTIKEWFSNLGPTIRSAFEGVIQSARSWGADLMSSFINGLSSMLNSLVSMLSGIAQTIRNFLGFSEPKEGPLSNFHTFAPDMMELYTKGISDNKNKVISAVGDLANGISDEMSGIKIGDGIDMPTVDTTSFANGVSYTPAVVAGGGFLPYNVEGKSVGDFGGSDVNREILTAVLQLQDLITQFEDSVENMQWVAKFGNIRAIVEEITKIQKQNSIARG